MRREIRADYCQMDLLPQCWEDLVPADHPARFLREFVDALDLRELGFAERESEEGRPPYANDLLLKVWLYGYLARIRSTRELERACREHISLLWLRGRHAPDHNTLWRFWRENRAALRQVFRVVVKVAAAQGLIGMMCHAVDGTKIRAVASRRTVGHQEDLEKELRRVEAWWAEMNAAVEAGELNPGSDYRLPEGLREAEQLRRSILGSLAQMRQVKREHLHRQEPEARRMPCEGRQEPAYNAQAVADAQAGLLVAEEVVNAESDNAQLIPMLEEVQANVGGVAQHTVADGGYSWGEQLQEAEARGQDVLVAEGAETGGPKRGEYHSAKLAYDEEGDEVICPQGQRLRFEGEKNKGRQRTVRSYRCQHYEQCPVRALCSQRRDGRRIEISPQYGALLRQRAKRRDPAQRALMRQRSGLIEPVFATLKQAMGFRRWTVRGLDNVRTQWALLCAVFNLKKMYKYWAAQRSRPGLKGLCPALTALGSLRIAILTNPGVARFVICPPAVTTALIHA